MITVWGRTNSMNVQKVLWVLDALRLPYEQINAGMQYGVNTTPEYLKMNPNGKVPVLKDGDFVIWESHAICKYLCNKTAGQTLYPADIQARARVDQWLDWGATVLFPPMNVVFWQLIRTPEDKRDAAKIKEFSEQAVSALAILSSVLATQPYVAGAGLTLADIALSAPAHRALGMGLIAQDDPKFAGLLRWFAQIKKEPGFQKWVGLPLS